MKVALQEEFIDEMAGLPVSINKGCRDVIRDLLRSDGKTFGRGMNLEKLKNSPFHTSRINKQYRILLKANGDTYVLCRVGDHDFVYSSQMARTYSAGTTCQVVPNLKVLDGVADPSGLTLDDIISRLNEQCQRATYGAIAGFLGGDVTPKSLMMGRPRNHFNSWVVAGGGPGYGRPTRYVEADIHPECRRQIRERLNDFITAPEILAGWLRAKRWHR